MYLFGLVSNGLTALIMDWSSLLDTREAEEGNPGLHSGRHGLLVDPLLGEGNEWITASKTRWRVARQRLAYGFDRCVVMATGRRSLFLTVDDASSTWSRIYSSKNMYISDS